jgi:hypothetical protein
MIKVLSSEDDGLGAHRDNFEWFCTFGTFGLVCYIRSCSLKIYVLVAEQGVGGAK